MKILSEVRSEQARKKIEAQVSRLKKLFPELSMATYCLPTNFDLPDDATNWFAIPRWQKVSNTYNNAVIRTMKLLENHFVSRWDCEWHYEELASDKLRQSERSKKYMKLLADKQAGHDILIVPTRLSFWFNSPLFDGQWDGKIHQRYKANEFGLGLFSVAVILLVGGAKKRDEEDYISCSGDEWDHPEDGCFSHAPQLDFESNDSTNKTKVNLMYGEPCYNSNASGYLL